MQQVLVQRPHPENRQKWQEPVILIERSLSVNAQDLGPLNGPAFGPLSGSVGS